MSNHPACHPSPFALYLHKERLELDDHRLLHVDQLRLTRRQRARRL